MSKSEKWQKLIVEWQGSGKSQAAFCRDHGLAQSSFNKYKNRFLGRSLPVRSDFAKVIPRPSKVVSNRVDIKLMAELIYAVSSRQQ